MRISELENGECFVVNKVLHGKEVGKRLAEMGFVKGATGSVVRCALLGDPVQIHILDYDVSIRKSEASGIEVERLVNSRRQHRHRRGHGHTGKLGTRRTI